MENLIFECMNKKPVVVEDKPKETMRNTIEKKRRKKKENKEIESIDTLFKSFNLNI
tara:strand:+ start:1301 stop:1468 length:168 start_codon:yes stop_codon:yes gene_type:complete